MSLSESWGSMISSGWLASKPQESTGPRPSTTGITSMNHHIKLCVWMPGIKPRSSCLHGQCFTHRTISLLLNYTLKSIKSKERTLATRKEQKENGACHPLRGKLGEGWQSFLADHCCKDRIVAFLPNACISSLSYRCPSV